MPVARRRLHPRPRVRARRRDAPRRSSVLALFDKPDPLDGPFFEETIYVTPSRATRRCRRRLRRRSRRAAARDRADARARSRGVPRERRGRLRPRSRRAADRRLVRVARCASRDGLRRRRPRWRNCCCGTRSGNRRRVDREARASGVMMIPIPRRGIFRARGRRRWRRRRASVHGIDDVRITAKADQLLVPLPEGASYLGFIFARGDSPEAVAARARAGACAAHLHIEPELRASSSA